MNTQLVFRIAMIVLFTGYTLPRSYFRIIARKARIEEQTGEDRLSESKLRLAIMGISGIGTNIVAFLWVINPNWFSWSNLDLPVWLRWVGAGIGVITIVLSYFIHHTLGQSFTPTLQTTKGHRLVTEGIYGWIRHPIYTTFFLLFIASFLMSTNWLIVALGTIYGLMIINRVIAEEKMMIETFDDQYQEYMQQTGRFWPKLQRG